MIMLFHKWLMKPVYFRYSFFILLSISVILNGVILENDRNFFILYIFCALFAGLGFYSQPSWFIFCIVMIIVICRFFLIPERMSGLGTFLIYLVTYLLLTFISVGLMKNYHKVKQDQLDLTIALSKALDSRDPYTLHHSENVAKYSLEIAKDMNLSKDLCEVIRIGGLLHDIGKIGVSENILNKPGKLTEDEYKIIKEHPKLGYDMVKHITSFKKNGVLDIVLHHHERYDGNGYPSGLKGQQIPLAARIVSIADTFDAMSSKRVYRDELELEYIFNEIRENKGIQFDPEIVDVFLKRFKS